MKNWTFSVHVAVIGLAISIGGASLPAQSDTPTEGFWAVDDLGISQAQVNAIEVVGDTLYLGGNFLVVGPPVAHVGQLQGATGTINASLPTFSTSPGACAPDGNGGWFVGGSTSLNVNGIDGKGLYHINPDGSLDETFMPDVGGASSGYVHAMAVSGDTLYVGGGFGEIDGEPRGNLAAFSISTGQLLPWNGRVSFSNGTAAQANTLITHGSNLYVGGNFNNANNGARTNIACMDGLTGDLGDLNLYLNGQVIALEISGEELVAGGQFSSFGGVGRTRLAAVDLTTNEVTEWRANPNNTVDSLHHSGDHLYVGGRFDAIGTVSRRGFAELELNGTVTDWDLSTNNGFVYSMTQAGDLLYAGGAFREVAGEYRPNLAVLDLNTRQVSAITPTAGRTVTELCTQGDDVLAMGSFGILNAVNRPGLCAIDLNTREVTSWDPQVVRLGGSYTEIYELEVDGSLIYVSGDFTQVGGQARNRLAAVNTTTGLAAGWNPVISGNGQRVYDIEIDGNTIYLAGSFTSVGGADRNGLAATDLSGNVLSWDPSDGGGSPIFHDIEIAGSTAYVGGSFAGVGSAMRANIAEINLSGNGMATSWDSGTNSTVKNIEVSPNHVYLGGQFNTAGNQSRRYLAQLDRTTGLATSWDPNPNIFANSIRFTNGQVYVGGSFNEIAGQSQRGFAILDPITGALDPWNPIPPLTGAEIFDVEVVGNDVYGAGRFGALGEVAVQGYAEFLGEIPVFLTPELTFDFLLGTGSLSVTEEAAADANMDGLINVADPVTLINMENQ